MATYVLIHGAASDSWYWHLVRERLGITPDEMDSGHLPVLAHPQELVERLDAYRSAT